MASISFCKPVLETNEKTDSVLKHGVPSASGKLLYLSHDSFALSRLFPGRVMKSGSIGGVIRFGNIPTGTLSARMPTTSVKRNISMKRGSSEKLVSAAFLRPHSFRIQFADGYTSTLRTSVLGISSGKVCWETICVKPSGDALCVTAIMGEKITIDSKRLRFLSDDVYAAELRESLRTIRLSRDELRDMSRSSEAPEGWGPESADDSILDSWK